MFQCCDTQIIFDEIGRFRCTVEHVKMKFSRVFNAIYSKSKAANSELVTAE